MMSWRWLADQRRWGLVAALAVALLALGQLSFAVRVPRLGLRAAADDGRLVVTWVRPAGLAWDTGVRGGDTITAVDGHTAMIGDAALVPGAAEITVQHVDNTVATATVSGASARAAQWRIIFGPLAAWFFIVGGLTFIMARERAATWPLLVAATAAAATLLASVATPFGAAWALTIVHVALTTFGAAFFIFFLRFPIDRLATLAGRAIVAVCLVLNLTETLCYGWVIMAQPNAYEFLAPTQSLLLLVELLGACALTFAAYWATPQSRHEARSALALVALGTAAGLLPFGLTTLAPRLLGQAGLVPPHVAALPLGFLPTGLAAAVLSHQLLGVTRLVRRGLVALVVWLGLLGAFALVLDALRLTLAARDFPLAAALGSTLTIGAIFAGAFPPLQAALRRALERRLFRDLYDYQGTVRDFGAVLGGLPGSDLAALADAALARLGATLDLTWAALVLRDGEDEPLIRRWGDLPPGVTSAALLGTDATMPSHQDRIIDDSGVARVPLVADGRPQGTLALGPKRHDLELTPEDVSLVAALAPLLAATLHNGTLARRLAARVETLAARERELAALSARLLTVQEEERSRLALDLHDDPLQRATLLARALGERADGRLQTTDGRALEEIAESLRAICGGLRPPLLAELGLPAALESLADNARARADQVIAVCVGHRPDGLSDRLDPALELALYRVAQEALNNALKHAAAEQVSLALAHTADRLVLRVADDGRGYPASNGNTPTGLGLVGMRERLRPWQGRVVVASGASGGTVVTATVPLGDDDGRG